VDGENIFPKLPVYLRSYNEQYLRNRRVQDAVDSMKSDTELLEELNKELVPEELMQQDQESGVDDFAPVHDSGDDMEERVGGPTTVAGWPQIPLPFIMPQPQGMARWPSGLGPPIVAGTMIGLATVSEAPLTRKRGGRGTDTKPRAKRRCQRCLQNQGNNAAICKGGNGAQGSKACQYFSNNI
jgi:hypothetical protein